MKREPNMLRRKLAAGQRAVGAAICSWSPQVVDVAGQVGLDFIRVDVEHAWRQDAMLEHLMRAAALGGVVPIVRVDRDNPYLVRKALEVGAGGIIVPDVCSPEDAEAVVRAAKFPPRGDRGYSGNCWSAGWGFAAGREWVEWSDREPMIGVMIENAAAIERLDQIMQVDGVDFAMFGAADYSMSLGIGAPNAADSRVQEALARTVDAAHRAGKYVALGAGVDPKQIAHSVDSGIDMLELGNDLGVLGAAWRRAAGEVAGAGETA